MSSPYILYSSDEKQVAGDAGLRAYAAVPVVGTEKSHIVCIRTKTPRSGGTTQQEIIQNLYKGGKFARYYKYDLCTYLPIVPLTYDEEFYDYHLYVVNGSVVGGNRPETLNNITTAVPGSQGYLCLLKAALGNYGTNGLPQSGTLLATELNASIGTDLAAIQQAAFEDLLDFYSNGC